MADLSNGVSLASVQESRLSRLEATVQELAVSVGQLEQSLNGSLANMDSKLDQLLSLEHLEVTVDTETKSKLWLSIADYGGKLALLIGGGVAGLLTALAAHWFK